MTMFVLEKLMYFLVRKCSFLSENEKKAEVRIIEINPEF